jgi:hypothetical protein
MIERIIKGIVVGGLELVDSLLRSGVPNTPPPPGNTLSTSEELRMQRLAALQAQRERERNMRN